MARHINPNRNTQVATAPYNFVPLPRQVFTVSEGIEVDGRRLKPWDAHDDYLPGTLDGWLDLDLRTLTPLFIRGAVREENGAWDEREARFRSAPYSSENGDAAIPGSSLRGMVRNLVEILSFSKIDSITNEKPFFRSLASDRIGKAYRQMMTGAGREVQGGHLKIANQEVSIEPAREILRVSHQVLVQGGIQPAAGHQQPNWRWQYKDCWFKRDPEEGTVVALLKMQQEQGLEKGVLVLTGDVPGKKADFVFTGRESRQISVPDAIWNRFCADDQITQWQKAAFPKSRRYDRHADGQPGEGDPVFFLIDHSINTPENPSGLVFLGRARMFRLPYDRSPYDLLPARLTAAGLDMAEAMFGTVSRSGEGQAIRGRVTFEDALSNESVRNLPTIVPRILASPKPTCYPQYLTQDGRVESSQQTTYLDGDETTIRGHKLYWHRWDEQSGLESVQAGNQKDLKHFLESQDTSDTQHTLISPVREGVHFRGRIRFHNLAPVELGALLAALRLPCGCAHKLGMGKPLGLGSVEVSSTLTLVDRQRRYGGFSASGAAVDDGDEYLRPFENAMLAHAAESGEAMVNGETGLIQITRLNALFCLLSWERKPALAQTAYLELDDFKRRRVLPTPQRVAGLQTPEPTDDPPRAGREPRLQRSSKTARAHATARHHAGNVRNVRDRTPVSGRAEYPVRRAARRLPAPAKPVEKGQERVGTLRRRGEVWVACFDGEKREATVANPGNIPAQADDSSKAEFFVLEQSKRKGIRVRFQRLM